MFEISIPQIIGFNHSMISELAQSILSLRSIDEVKEWDKKASSEIEKLLIHVHNIEVKQQLLSTAIIEEKQKHESKSFFAKLFDSQEKKKLLVEKHNQMGISKKMLIKTIDDLTNAIAFTPDSPEDVKDLIKECRNTKKELRIQKKTVNSQMTSIRVEARQKSSQTIYGKYGKWDRRMIQLNKEAALQPHENEKTALERQIIKLDQMELWLERFL
jgi:hypothetical protein